VNPITMSDLFAPQRVLARLRARNKTAALRELAGQIARDAGVPADAILQDVLSVADLPPFMPRGGVSLLHALVPQMKRPMAAFARLQPALNFGAPDGCLTDIAVLLASPTGRPQDHPRALSRIARRLRRLDVRALIRAAANADAIFVALTSEEWFGTSSGSGNTV